MKKKTVIEKREKYSSITFAEIGGMDDVVRQVREVIELPLVAPDIFEHYQIKPHKGILLYGPLWVWKDFDCPRNCK